MKTSYMSTFVNMCEDILHDVYLLIFVKTSYMSTFVHVYADFLHDVYSTCKLTFFHYDVDCVYLYVTYFWLFWAIS